MRWITDPQTMYLIYILLLSYTLPLSLTRSNAHLTNDKIAAYSGQRPTNLNKTNN